MLSSALRACWTSHVNPSQRETNISPNERRRQLLVVFQSKEAVQFLLFVDKTPVRDHHPILWKLQWKGGERCPVVFSLFYGFLTLSQQANSPNPVQIRSPSPHVNVSTSVGRKKAHRSQPLGTEKANNAVMKLKMESSQIQVSTRITAKCHCSLFFPPLPTT